MRIATWNVESLKTLTPERKSAFHGAMAGVDADVWVLTETWTTFSPGPDYRLLARSQTAEDLKPWPDRCWVSIWTKPPLVAMPLKVHRHSDRMAGGRIETPGRADIVIVGTVLPWNGDKLWPKATDFCAAVASQAEEWGALRGDPDGCTLVVAGDFNQSVPYEQWYGSKTGEVAVNSALRELDLLCLTDGNCPLAGRPRIDHICVGRNGLAPDCLPRIGGWAIPTVNDRPVTDHSGVYVDLLRSG